MNRAGLVALLLPLAVRADPALHMTVLKPAPATRPTLALAATPDGPPLHMTLLTGSPPSPAAGRYRRRPFRFHYSAGLGYRRDRLDWNIGIPAGPDVLTEEKWRDLDSLQLAGGAHLVTPVNLTFQARAAYAWVLDGRYQRTDYLENDRTSPFSQTQARADHGHLLDLSAGFGYRFQPDGWKVRPWVEPLAGYGYRERTLYANDFRQTLATDGLTPPPGRIPQAEYRYHAHWHGPWVGMGLGIEGERWRLFGQGEYHFIWYRADGRFKALQAGSRKVRFEQDADGDGIVAALGGSYRIWRTLSLQLSARFQRWEVKDGTDKTRIGDGPASKTRFNRSRWRTIGGLLSLSFDF